jgi:WD40 repeat protein
VFVSYSRRDKEFVTERLLRALVAAGKEAWVDLEDIPPAADWRDKVLAGVESANALIFVISPASVASEICREELDRGVALHKRLVPVARSDPHGASVPEPLARANWVWMRDEDDFDHAFASVVEALETDLAWRDAHTRFAVRTAEWLAHDQDGSYLLRGSDLRSAEEWLKSQAGHREHPTAEQVEYIVASRQAAARRQRVTIGAVTLALVVAIALAVVALLQRNLALDRERVAKSRELAASALAVLPNDPELSVLLAAEGARRKPTAEAEDSLRRAMADSWVRATLPMHGVVAQAAFDRSGRRVITGSLDGTAAVWDARSGRRIATMRGHGDQVWGAAFNPDGTRVVTASADRTARVWDSRSGRQLAVLRGAAGLVVSPSFSPDGGRILAASSDHIARIWDAGTGRLAVSLVGHRDAIFNAAFDAGGDRVVTSSADGTARVWDARTGAMTAVLRVPGGWVNRAAFSRDGRLVATANQDDTARVWRAGDGTPVAVLRGHSADVRSVAFSPDGRRLVSTSNDGTASVWDVGSKRQVAVLRGHTDTVDRAVFDRTGTIVGTASEDGTARVWDSGSGEQIAVLRGHRDTVGGLSFAPAGRSVLTFSDDGTARLWRMPDVAGVALRGDRHPVKGAVLSHGGGRAVSWSDHGTAWIWDARTGRRLRTLRGAFLVQAAGFSRDGSRLITATAAPDGIPLRIWDAASGRLIRKAGSDQLPTAMSLSPDGRRAATVGLDGSNAMVWDVATGRRLAVLRGHSGQVSSATISPDGRRVVTTSLDGTIRAWEVAGGRPTGRLDVSPGFQSPQAAFSPTGEWVVTTSAEGPIPVWNLHSSRPSRFLRARALIGQEVVDVAVSEQGAVAAADRQSAGVVRVFDPQSGRVTTELRGHRNEVRAIAFSPDGRWLASASLDGTGRVFEAGTGRTVDVLRGAHDGLTEVQFGDDGRHVITAGKDGTARVYDCQACLPLSTLIEEAPRFVSRGRTLTDAERSRYLH